MKYTSIALSYVGFYCSENEYTDSEGINGVISVKCQIDHLHMVIIINIEINLYK